MLHNGVTSCQLGITWSRRTYLVRIIQHSAKSFMEAVASLLPRRVESIVHPCTTKSVCKSQHKTVINQLKYTCMLGTVTDITGTAYCFLTYCQLTPLLTAKDRKCKLIDLATLLWTPHLRSYWLNISGPVKQARAEHMSFREQLVNSRTVVTACASAKTSLPGNRVGLERIVPPSLSCLLPVALGRDEVC